MTSRAQPRRPRTGAQSRADRSREAVVRETARYILEEGFTAPSVRQITQRSGFTWGAVQYHFGDLGGLLLAVVDEGFAALGEALERLPAILEGLPRDQRTEAAIDELWNAFSSPVSMAAMEILVATRVARTDEVNARLGAVMHRLTDFGRILGEDLSAPLATEIGNLVWATLRGIATAQLVSPQPIDTARDRKALVMVLNAYLRDSRGSV